MFLNLGGGRFAVQPDYYDFDGSGETVVATDFNGDSLPDIAISSKSTDSVVVMYNDGRGKFPPLNLKRVPGGSAPDQMAAGDIDADGKIDLVTVGNISNVYVLWFLFNEGAQFPTSDPGGIALAGRIPTDFAFEDVNGDGRPDWVVADIRPGDPMAGEPQVVSEVEPIFNKFPTPPDPFISYLTAGSLGKVGVADLNGDNKKDLIVTGAYLGGQQVDNNKLTLLFNQTGTILQQPRTEVVTIPRPFALAMADFNKDGKIDVALPAAALDGPGKIGFHLNQGNGMLPTADDIPLYDIGFGPASTAAADFNSDGKPDIVVVSLGAPKVGQSGAMTLFLNTTR